MNEGDTMSKILKDLYQKSAEDILRECNITEYPVDLKKILENYGISAQPYDFKSLESKINEKDIIGLVLADDKNVGIYYEAGSNAQRQRFTIAHELGHICCHLEPNSEDYPYIDFRKDADEKSQHEKMADDFALELLIPFDMLKKAYMSSTDLSTVAFASMFGTSIHKMEDRLNSLKISHYDRYGRAIVYGN